MSASQTVPTVRCPECGAGVRADEERCWLCHRQLGAAGENPFAPPAEIARTLPGGGAAQFSLETVLLVVTLIAVCLGAFQLSPGLGVFVVVLATPALVRTVVAGVQEKQHGRRLTAGDKIGTFAASLGVMLLAGVAGIAAFLAACFGTCGIAAALSSASPGGSAEALFWVALIISVGIGLFVVGLVIWAFRPGRS